MKHLNYFNSHSEYTDPTIKPNVSYCKLEDEVHYNPRGLESEYLTFNIITDGTIAWIPSSENTELVSISYSLDEGETWNELLSISPIGSIYAEGSYLNVHIGDKIFFKGFEGDDIRYGKYIADEKYAFNHFAGTSIFDVSGNILSLRSDKEFEGTTFLSNNGYAFTGLFYESNVRSAENLIMPNSVEFVDNYSDFSWMFMGCEHLTIAPKLPMLNLSMSCYEGMFKNCTSLIVAPDLPAITLKSGCYCSVHLTNVYSWSEEDDHGMFEGCTSLVLAPRIAAANFISTNRYGNEVSLPKVYAGMFKDCTSLRIAPELPCTNLTNSCYAFMFSGCTSLITAPDLPATTLANNCYTYMFDGCSSLNYIKCLATNISASECTNTWVNNVAVSGTFVKAPSMTDWLTGSNGIPSGWTVEIASN